MSIPSNSSKASFAIRLTSSEEPTFPIKMLALTPISMRVSAVCSQAFTSELPFKTILQPVDAKLIAIALPIFLPPPVMNAVFPECSMAFPLRYNIKLVSYDL